MKPTLRRDLVTGRWSVVAPGRKSTPRDVVHATTVVRDASECPFCPGHEAMTEVEFDRRTDRDGAWVARAVANRFPMFAEDAAVTLVDGEQPAQGRHEVIIEARDHHADFADFTVDHTATLLDLYRARWNALARLPEVRTVALFKNRGPRSGASLRHPHAQLVTLPMVAAGVALRDRRARRRFEKTGKTPIDTVRAKTLRDGSRVIAVTDRWVVMAPFAPSRGHEVWVVPRFVWSHFGALSDADVTTLAPVLLDAMQRQAKATESADYNVVVRSPAVEHWDKPWARAWIELLTRRGGDAGFELSTGVNVAAVSPEETAQVFREAL